MANRYKNLSKYEYDSNNYTLELDESYVKRCKRQFDFIFDNADSLDSILEIGAASGYNLSLYKLMNSTAAGGGIPLIISGIEPSEINCNLALKNYDIQLFNGMFSDYIKNKPERKFDLIFTSHVLEHIVNPRDFIKLCRTINNKYMFIEVPTFDYKFENEFLGMFSDEHMCYFTFESLSNLMNSCGYTIVEAYMPFGIQNKIAAGFPAMSTLWQLIDEGDENKNVKHIPVNNSNMSLENYMKSNEKVISRVREIINSILPSTKLAVWGTGNHTSRLLGATTLSEKNIIKFYDSDSKKYNHQILGKNIEKFDPHNIESGEIDAILISAYTAQKAIKDIIDKCDLNVQVITLY
jgi:hypothetical protein